ncbi:hypothetical protein CRENBAI_018567 [Crenichthys baileyi]|uniref:Uncharacterized protein n=1 Tax=Crenichthys baileyi TaxID=28760 RepID=A0AAV9R3K8_9TELE
MANVADLLGSTNIVSKKNPSMSKPFMLYQLFAMISAILGPATICLMVAASMVKEKTILTPSSIFIVAMSIIYIVTALMHPQELPLVFFGILYIACVPSAYLLLTIYSMVNMNSVSWGTREAKPAAGAATTAVTVQQTTSQKATTTLKRLCSWMKCCKTSNQRSEDEQLSIRQENLNPEPTQPEPQPQNTILDDASENEQE